MVVTAPAYILTLGVIQYALQGHKNLNIKCIYKSQTFIDTSMITKTKEMRYTHENVNYVFILHYSTVVSMRTDTELNR